MRKNKNYDIKLIEDGEEYKDEECRNCDIFLINDKYNRIFKIKNFIKEGDLHFELYDKNDNNVIEYKCGKFNIIGEATKKEDFDNWIKMLTDFKEIIKDKNIFFASSGKQQEEVFCSFLARYSSQLKENEECQDFCLKIDDQVSLLKTAGRKLVTEKLNKYFIDRKKKENNIKNRQNNNREENKILKQEDNSFFQKLLKTIFPDSIYRFFYPVDVQNVNNLVDLNSFDKKSHIL